MSRCGLLQRRCGFGMCAALYVVCISVCVVWLCLSLCFLPLHSRSNCDTQTGGTVPAMAFVGPSRMRVNRLPGDTDEQQSRSCALKSTDRKATLQCAQRSERAECLEEAVSFYNLYLDVVHPQSPQFEQVSILLRIPRKLSISLPSLSATRILAEAHNIECRLERAECVECSDAPKSHIHCLTGAV